MLGFYSNGVDIIIAESADDAKAVYQEHTGEIYDYDDEFEPIRNPDDIVSVVWVDGKPNSGHVPARGYVKKPGSEGGYYSVVATAEQWIAHNGRCYFSSTEW